jgi:hypothetical protein
MYNVKLRRVCLFPLRTTLKWQYYLIRGAHTLCNSINITEYYHHFMISCYIPVHNMLHTATSIIFLRLDLSVTYKLKF